LFRLPRYPAQAGDIRRCQRWQVVPAHPGMRSAHVRAAMARSGR